ncbi:GNAT family N-acetyltransferase [Streptococcus orisratti]|uniref:GNAT family N-acetyltransferase n=1 Tax=Streptococcus orisratti TaxID=114652 RepID=UPI0023F7FE11|nr:GNAT family N-acetyltransferase [Streptococcus orisratti]
MSTLILVQPSEAYLSEIAVYKAAFEESGEHMHGNAGLINFDSLKDWLRHVEKFRKGIDIPENRVPSSAFLCIRESDNKMVGICNIRHNLTLPHVFNTMGHIGYSIHPHERRKGYAKEQLRLALIEAGKLGIDRVLLTCDETNIGSEKTILANGGIYENTYHNSEDGSRTKRFWIEVPK